MPLTYTYTLLNRQLSYLRNYLLKYNINNGILLISDASTITDVQNLRQLVLKNNKQSLKIHEVNTIKDYLIASTDKFKNKLQNKKIIHVYFKLISTSEFMDLDMNDNEINDNFEIIRINFDIYNISDVYTINLDNSSSIYYTIKNIKDKQFSIQNIPNILNIILQNKELITLINISYDDFIMKSKLLSKI